MQLQQVFRACRHAHCRRDNNRAPVIRPTLSGALGRIGKRACSPGLVTTTMSAALPPSIHATPARTAHNCRRPDFVEADVIVAGIRARPCPQEARMLPTADTSRQPVCATLPDNQGSTRHLARVREHARQTLSFPCQGSASHANTRQPLIPLPSVPSDLPRPRPKMRPWNRPSLSRHGRDDRPRRPHPTQPLGTTRSAPGCPGKTSSSTESG